MLNRWFKTCLNLNNASFCKDSTMYIMLCQRMNKINYYSMNVEIYCTNHIWMISRYIRIRSYSCNTDKLLYDYNSNTLLYNTDIYVRTYVRIIITNKILVLKDSAVQTTLTMEPQMGLKSIKAQLLMSPNVY